MAIKQILAALAGGRDVENAAIAAINLAKRLSAHVSFTAAAHSIGLNADTESAIMPLYYEAAHKALEHAYACRRAQAHSIYKHAVEKSGISEDSVHLPSATWIDAKTFDGTAITNLGLLTDLVVVPQPDAETGILDRATIEEALFTVQRPVLTLPEHVGEFAHKAAIGWNGSLEASNAVESAIDLLPRGAEVTIIQFGDIRVHGSTSEHLAAYLTWHGLKPKVCKFPDASRQTGQLLLQVANAEGADLLVIGAYTHSRLRQFVLGGVTEYMLKFADMPVLYAH